MVDPNREIDLQASGRPIDQTVSACKLDLMLSRVPHGLGACGSQIFRWLYVGVIEGGLNTVER